MSPSEVARSILVVDDDTVFRTRLARAFTERGLDVTEAINGQHALQLAAQDTPELALVDLNMPGMGGLTLVKELLALDPSTRIVVLTGYGSIATALEAVRLGAVHYLQKPADPDDILLAFDRRDKSADVNADPPLEVPSLARVEWEHIQRVLTDCGGNVSQTARLLGMHRRSLQRKLMRHPARR